MARNGAEKTAELNIGQLWRMDAHDFPDTDDIEGLQISRFADLQLSWVYRQLDDLLLVVEAQIDMVSTHPYTPSAVDTNSSSSFFSMRLINVSISKP
ncbi:hypothetical protein PAV_5c01240 [Paenibacillus alvei DSM 29]|nr:hypothetical protein PAV_5c01240 [Paenibacillus alvei DSM 29]